MSTALRPGLSIRSLALRPMQSTLLRCTRRNLSLQSKTSRPLLASTRTSRYANQPTNTTPPSFFTPSLCKARNASTVASNTSSANPNAPQIQQQPIKPADILSWNPFFKLRTSRRRFSLVSSLLTAAATTSAAVVSLSTSPEAGDMIAKLIPIDPIASLGIATVAAAFLGWLIGPFFGNGLWRLLNRGQMPEFMAKERAFFEKIKRRRVDPSGQSANNPVPDYYGEKIGDVQGYRRWLKDQRAFNRKRGGLV